MIAFLLIVIDQITKYFANIYKPSLDIIGDFFKVQYIENTGTIFGLLENSNYLFVVLAIILCVAIVFYMKKNVEKNSVKEKAFVLILAGGIGNLIDRIIRGFVVDFISLKWVGIFNFSDMYIVLGVTIIVLIELKDIFEEKRKN